MNTNGGTLTINPHLAISTTSTIKLRIRRGYVGTATAGTLTVQTRTGTTTNAIIVGLKNDTPVATFNISGTTANAMNMHMVLYDGKWYLSQ
jgi:hypothetical protein